MKYPVPLQRELKILASGRQVRKKQYNNIKEMKRFFFIILGSINICLAHAQSFNGQYISEWQWDMNKNTNLINQLRLELSVPIGKGKDSFEAATLHVAKTNDGIIDDWQGFSNIDADNNFAMLAVLGYMHEWNSGHLFVGVRNVNEDFFTSDVTALFQNSSEGIFPTVASSYPIANYPYSGLTLYFDVTKGKWTFRNSLYNGAGYNGWKAHDNPFLVRPKKDGIFNMSQLEYNDKGGKYFAGAAVHTRQYPINEDGEMVSADESKGKTTCAWWVYGEQSVWKAGDKNISCMVQYSENTSHQNACYRYAELDGAYLDEKNECGLSGQYARFRQGSEYSLEVTWKRQLTESISLQPSFQYIKNDNGDFTALSARLYVSF